MIVLPSYAATRSAFRYIAEVEGAEYIFRFRWLERAKSWYLDILLPDGTDEGAPLVLGVRVVVSWSLLFRHPDDRLPPGEFIVVDMSGDGRDITHQAELGDEARGGRVRIVYLTAAEAAELGASLAVETDAVEVTIL